MNQPPNSRIASTGVGKRVTLTVPAPGFGGKTFYMAPLCFAMTSLPAIGLYLALHDARFYPPHDLEQWWVLLILVFMLAVCLLLCMVATHFATRRIQLDAEDGVLAMQFKGLLRTSCRRCLREDIRSIKVGFNTMIRTKYDGRGSPLALEIALPNRRCICMGTGLTQDELLWMASDLNHALDLNQK